MEFRPEHADEFLVHFNGIKHAIRRFPGVQQLELHRDAGQSNVFYTFSIWNAEEDLEAYRKSQLFKDAWAQAKSWFAAKPHAYSLKREFVVD